MKSHSENPPGGVVYISGRQLSQRWQCSRSSVDRIARRAGLARLCLGDGKNGMIRYVREEVIAYENSRQSKPQS